MYLAIEERRLAQPVTPEQIERCIREAATGSECFVSLHHDEKTFLQAALGRDEPVMLMACSADLAEGLIAAPQGWGPNEVTRLFCLYLVGDNAWRTDAPWQQGVQKAAIAAAHRQGRILLRRLVKTAAAIALVAVTTAVAMEKMPLKAGIILLVNLCLFGLYFAWLGHYFGRIRPRFRDRFGHWLGVEIIDADWGPENYTGWQVAGDEHPVTIGLLVFGTDMVCSISAVMVPFTLLTGLVVFVANGGL